MEKHNITFWEVVLAVVLGLTLFEWIKDLKSNPDFVSWITPIFWGGIITYIVGGTIVEQWHERRKWKEHDEKELEFVRSQGFESWAEYMVVHGQGDDVRESWKKRAAEEKMKREKQG
jgi:hypothetical protein